MTIKESATLAIDRAVRERRDAGADPLHLGFGEVGLPVLPELVDALVEGARHTGYGRVAGPERLCAAAAAWFERRGRPTGPDQIVFAPGSKPLLFALLSTVDGDVVLPQPSWVSYAAQVTLTGGSPIWVPIGRDAGGVPDPVAMRRALWEARARGQRPGAVVLTVPDNPTGTVAGAERVAEVCEIAAEWGLAVICDEIYAELAHQARPVSAATLLPDRTVTTTGLSKSLGIGGWRIGFARFPDNAWGERLRTEVTALASEVWSSPVAPMQEVVAYALADPPSVTARIERSRRLHGRVATALHDRLVAAGVSCRRPAGGFYLYPDLEPHRDRLAARGVRTGTELAAVLLDEQGVATLPGAAFGDPDAALRLRLATSQMYGATDEQRLTALDAAQPERLPWIAADLARFGDALEDLLT